MSEKSSKRHRSNINSIIENDTKSQKLDSDSIDSMDDETFTPNSNSTITISSTKSHSSIKTVSTVSKSSVDGTSVTEIINSNSESSDNDEYSDVEEDNDDDKKNSENKKSEGEKKNSDAWKYFKIVDHLDGNRQVKCTVKHKDKTKCKYVAKYHESTTYLWTHLGNHHNIHKDQKSINEGKKSSKFVDNDSTNYLLLMFILTAALPFRCVENKYFKEFIKQLNPNYKVPSRHKISELTTRYYNEKKKKLHNKLSKCSLVTLTTDCWVSIQNFSYIGLTAHYLNKNLKINSACLAVRNILGKF